MSAGAIADEGVLNDLLEATTQVSTGIEDSPHYLTQVRTDAEHVCNCIGIPALGEHRDRHNAANLTAKPPLLSNRIHHLAKQV